MSFIKPSNSDYNDSSVAPTESYIGIYTTLKPSAGYEWTGGASGTAQTKYFCKEHSTDKTLEGIWTFENGATAINKSLLYYYFGLQSILFCGKRMSY